MKQLLQQETRSETIFRHTNLMLHGTRMDQGAFAQTVAEYYERTVAAPARCIDFKMSGPPAACMKANGQKIFRYMDPMVSARLPDDLEEAWVQSLIDPYKTNCRRDLARRYGFLDVPIPDSQGASDMVSVSRFTSEFGEALKALAPTLGDGLIDKKDAEYIPHAITELEAVISAATGLIQRLKAANAGA